MVEGGPTPGRVETGVGSVSRGAGAESNLPDIGATYVTVWIRIHIYYQQFHKTIAYLLT